jgi:hypothetical protein
MRIITSPGFVVGEPYPNNSVVRYNIQCKADELAFFNVPNFTLQKGRCSDGSCKDYVQIETPHFGSTEKMCGFVPPDSFSKQLALGNFRVVFRTGGRKSFDGFQMYITCMGTADIPPPSSARKRRSAQPNTMEPEPLMDCTDVSEFTSGACAEFGKGTTPRPPPRSRKRKSCSKIASFYNELFPGRGYPPRLRISPDLAKFHQPWSRLMGIPGLVTEVDVFYNHTVNYTGDTIIVTTDMDGEKQARHDVRVLWTFDSNGTIQKYVHHVTDNRNPHFHGAGLMRIINKHAYFQLFVVDPREIVPNEAEQRELLLMVTPLVNSNESLLLDFNYTDSYDLEDIFNFGDDDRDAVLAALRSKASCNPVLKAQSRATLTYYNDMDPNFVDSLKTFNIFCSSTGFTLSCESLENNIVVGRTLCQFDDQPPISCDPFTRHFEINRLCNRVTVSALNCVGQTAKEKVAVFPIHP